MPIRCYICGFEFGRRFNLNRHIKSQHLSSVSDHKNNRVPMTKVNSPNMEQVERLKQLCSAIIDQTDEENNAVRNREVALRILDRCYKTTKNNEVVQVGRGLPQPSTDNQDIPSEESDSSPTDNSDDSESDEPCSMSEEESDEEIKACMADIMYICCQRPDKRRDMLENSSQRLINCICSCAKNVLTGEIPINYHEKDALEKHKDVLRQLSDPNKSTLEKKEIIVQNGGGFLLSLIPTVVGAIAAMLQ